VIIRMTFDEWVKKYKPTNLDNLYIGASFHVDFPRTAWTKYSADGEEMIMNGVGRVNADGYYMCEIPYKEGDCITIILKE